MRISFVGDSITEGFPGTSYVDRIQQAFPQHTLINLGRHNDTVLSLYRRLRSTPLAPPVDLCFLWIGVNDTICRDTPTYRLANRLAPQQKARDDTSFEVAYRQVLALLAPYSEQVVALTLPFKGENPASACNRELDARSQLIARIARDSGVALFDIRAHLRPHFEASAGDYLVQSAAQALLDAFLLRSDEALTRIAARRGLHLTFDGLHLSPAGADLAAHLFADHIRMLENANRTPA
ncbi:MAG: hypothetical protein GYB64_16560 [Chloroflexi bacterium]|nr:hypothetical protein [Chloroflexota bacterium]